MKSYTPKRTRVLGVVFLALALVACGSDDAGDDGGSASAVAAKTACHANCDATASCDTFLFTDAAECKAYDCDWLTEAPDACATAFKNYYDCANAKSDVCDDTGCEVDFDACM